ncbi:helical backbone metal receptor [Nocardioides sp.]|uniref:helical backbone metal receptor n=1 Tax=Nocardioides sp. TaxID=35761 RepID=UPI003D14CE83
MVPSWTETLVRCGLPVVGRTRFCIHPAPKNIPVVGGTKDWSLAKLAKLNPDLVILDREENPKFMAIEAPCEVFATHVTSVGTVALELERLALRLNPLSGSAELHRIATRWRAVRDIARTTRQLSFGRDFPGVSEWLHPPSGNVMDPRHHQLVYVIWKDPWMCAGRGTFIASMLEILGWPTERLWAGGAISRSAQRAETKYPMFELQELPKSAIVFFSTEPFPFHKRKDELRGWVSRPCAIVDGESFSWFGIRSLEFLERAFVVP